MIQEPLYKEFPSNMVLGSFLSGTCYQENKIILASNGIKPCSRTAFFAKQAEILPKVEKLGTQSAQDEMDESVSLNHTFYSQDSRWSSQFNGLENTNALIDKETGKVVSFHNTLKSRSMRETEYNGSSNMMESNGLKFIADELKERFGDQELSICHDSENKSPKVFASSGLNVIHHRDGGHALNSIKNAWKNFKSDFSKMYHKRPFGSLDERIAIFAGYLLSKVEDPATKVSLWLNAPNHFVGDHRLCSHPRKTRGRPRKTLIDQNDDFEIWQEEHESERF